MPRSVFAFTWRTTRLHQLWLSLLTAAVFLINLVPLELQRRIVNEALENKELRVLAWLAAAYFATNLVQGGLKFGLNVYRGWVAERATLALRRAVGRQVDEIAADGGRSPADQGVRVSIAVAEVEPVGSFVGSAISEPLLQVGILVSVFIYLLFLQPWLALASVGLFATQLIFVPPLQRAINRRTVTRINALRGVSGRMVAEVEKAVPVSPQYYEQRIGLAFLLNMGIYVRKYLMNLLMNALYHFNVTGVFLVGGWLAITGRMEYGAVVAFVSGLSQINDPWGDLVNYFRDLTNAQVKYRLIESFLNRPQPAAAA
jgi:ABC-type bacteriocin/lantibiotic exporter with double-glycine peptidase domain